VSVVSYYKKEEDLNSLSLDDLTLGAVGSLTSLSVGYVVMKGSERILEEWGIQNLESQTYFQVYETIEKISSGLLRGILKCLAIVYVAILVPVLEEWIFRDLLYKWQEESLSSRVYRVLANGIVFGAFHYSIMQGWANILIVAVTTIAGIVFAALRELRGDRWASTVAHSLNNSLVLGMNFLRI